MKILTFIFIATAQIICAQNNTIAKFKYEEAEQAFVNEDYETTIAKLVEAEKLFGKVNPPILYLRIMAQNNLLSDNPHNDPLLLLSLHKNCKFYLKEYANMDAVEDKYREVYLVSDYIKIYSDNPEFFKARSLYYGTDDTPQDLSKAYELCTKLVQSGDDHAMNLMGVMYKSGIGVEQNNDKAMECYKKSADKGNVFGLSNLAYDYYFGHNVEKDYAKALKLFQQAATKGYPIAENKVGNIYYYGYGVSKDYNEAFKWYQKAAAKKNADAMANLGYLYFTGKGVPENEKIGFEWAQKAANLGSDYGMFLLGFYYQNGYGGLTKNPKEALKWYLKGQYPNSITIIAEMYKNGEGTEKDYNEAYKWYLKAVEKDDSGAMFEIGNLYYLGVITTNSETTNNSNNNSSEEKSANTNLIGNVLVDILQDDTLKMTGIGKPNYTEAMSWYLKAAEKNNDKAMSRIANMYLEGIGVKKDKKLAKEWTNKALIAESQKK